MRSKHQKRVLPKAVRILIVLSLILIGLYLIFLWVVYEPLPPQDPRSLDGRLLTLACVDLAHQNEACYFRKADGEYRDPDRHVLLVPMILHRLDPDFICVSSYHIGIGWGRQTGLSCKLVGGDGWELTYIPIFPI